MPTDRPDAAELLAAVREHLTENLAPTLKGQPAFHLLVATNVLALVERTLTEGGEMNHAEQERLQKLLGEEGDLIELNQTLASKIKSGELDDQKEAVLTHLRETSVDKLRLVNPKYAVPRD